MPAASSLVHTPPETWRRETDEVILEPPVPAADGEDACLLRQLRKAVTLAGGGIIIADGGSNEVRRFDAEGAHVGSRGGFGEGPGDFDELRAVARRRGDSIAAWDHFPHPDRARAKEW